MDLGKYCYSPSEECIVHLKCLARIIHLFAQVRILQLDGTANNTPVTSCHVKHGDGVQPFPRLYHLHTSHQPLH